ncbi:methyltransferase domain-containing protein [Paenibacillus beijingensis]|nr:methyltransferase domain-containing protein [Paenibacillus beijingensis]
MSNIYEQTGVAMTCRGFDEYIRMFDLKPADLEGGETADIAAGGSSFAAEAFLRGQHVTAIDPRYAQAAELWVEESSQEIETSTAKLAAIADIFDWTYYGNIERHHLGRADSLAKFAADVVRPDRKGSYVAGALPSLPVEDGRFRLVLCSHFLFLYARQFGYKFHRDALLELLRICKPGGQVRIYPLSSLHWEPYARMDDLLTELKAAGAETGFFTSRLPFIPGSTEGLLISRPL